LIHLGKGSEVERGKVKDRNVGSRKGGEVAQSTHALAMCGHAP